MNKILLYEPDIKLNDIYRSLVDSCVFNHEVIVLYEPEDVTKYLQYEASGLKLCILDHDDQHYGGVRLAQDVSKMGLDVPFILLTNNNKITKTDLSEIQALQKDSMILSRQFAKSDDIAFAIVETLKKSPDVSSNDFNESDFCGVSPLLLMYSNNTPSDIYSKTEDGKFVILFNSDAEVSARGIQEFISRGMKKFFILTKDRDAFYDFYLDFLGNKEFSYSAQTETSDLIVQQNVLGMAYDRIKDLGADDKLIEVAKNNLEHNLELINQSSNLKKLLSKIVGLGEIGFEHSMSAGMTAQMILKKIGWKSPDTQYKISLAAFFHDLYAPEFDEKMLRKENLREYDWAAVKKNYPDFFNHPAKAAEFLDSLPDVPPDTGQIIASHHELPKGRGIPKRLFGARTAPLACVFNTAHYFCLSLYEHGWNKKGLQITFTDMDTFFKDTNYEKPYSALKSLFK